MTVAWSKCRGGAARWLGCSALLLAACLPAAPSAAPAAPPVAASLPDRLHQLDAKDAFTKGFPQFLAFRGELKRPAHKDYATWSDYFRGTAGVIRKFAPEELPVLNPQSHLWADQYALEHPNMLMLLHLNGEARQVMDFPDVHARYFPGHWVYEPGTVLAADAGPAETVLKVQKAKPFKIQAYIDREKDGSKSWFPHHILLVHVDEGGHRLWDESEYVILKSVDYQRNTITVERGQMFSKARAHPAGRTYAAPIAGGVWGGKPMWFYNLSSACPKDRNGHNAADVFISEISQWFSATGRLRHFNGIAFDVVYWKAHQPSWDTDDDGTADGGLVGGRNVWREGGWYFLTGLRKALGDGFLLTSDGEHEDNQQAVGVLDGIESEGLVQHNDGFRGFSRTINTYLYWQENAVRPHDFRYVVLKLMNPKDAQRGDQLRRFATGTACCLGALVTAGEGDFLPQNFTAPGSLGFPKSPLVRGARQAPDLLSGAGSPIRDELVGGLKPVACLVQREGGGLVISTPTQAKNAEMKLTLAGLKIPAGDLTVFLEMQALDPLEGFAKDDRVPRLVRAKISKVPDYGEGRYNQYYADLYGLIGTHGLSTLSFYFRRPGAAAESLDLTIEIEGRGRVNLRSITAHNSPDILGREFERGVVVVNPALETVTVSLGKLFPQRRGLPASLHVPALDAQFLSPQ